VKENKQEKREEVRTKGKGNAKEKGSEEQTERKERGK